MFEVPKGWFPWYVEWVLGFPRCPYGGVSINMWSTCCGIVIALVADGVVGFVSRNEVELQKGKEKVKVATGVGGGKKLS